MLVGAGRGPGGAALMPRPPPLPCRLYVTGQFMGYKR